jgi:hypothetical protein
MQAALIATIVVVGVSRHSSDEAALSFSFECTCNAHVCHDTCIARSVEVHCTAAGGGSNGGIFTVELSASGSANIVGTFLTTAVSSGAADITAAPSGKLYVVNSPSLGSSQAYEVRHGQTCF